jgi:hypothetical protein
VDLSPQTRAPDVGGNRVGHRADGEHRVHRAELFLAAPVQNVGIGRKHVQQLGRPRCAMRRLDVLHQVRELFRRHIHERIRFVLVEVGLLISRRKLVERHPGPGVAGE